MKYRWITRFSMGPHAIHIQPRHDGEKKWLTNWYKLTDEEVDSIIDEWHVDWKVLVSVKDLLDIDACPTPDAPI